MPTHEAHELTPQMREALIQAQEVWSNAWVRLSVDLDDANANANANADAKARVVGDLRHLASVYALFQDAVVQMMTGSPPSDATLAFTREAREPMAGAQATWISPSETSARQQPLSASQRAARDGLITELDNEIDGLRSDLEALIRAQNIYAERNSALADERDELSDEMLVARSVLEAIAYNAPGGMVSTETHRDAVNLLAKWEQEEAEARG
jgi:hypothetical protein